MNFVACSGRNLSFFKTALIVIRVCMWAVMGEEGRKAQGEEAGAGEVFEFV